MEGICRREGELGWRAANVRGDSRLGAGRAFLVALEPPALATAMASLFGTLSSHRTEVPNTVKQKIPPMRQWTSVMREDRPDTLMCHDPA